MTLPLRLTNPRDTFLTILSIENKIGFCEERLGQTHTSNVALTLIERIAEAKSSTVAFKVQILTDLTNIRNSNDPIISDLERILKTIFIFQERVRKLENAVFYPIRSRNRPLSTELLPQTVTERKPKKISFDEKVLEGPPGSSIRSSLIEKLKEDQRQAADLKERVLADLVNIRNPHDPVFLELEARLRRIEGMEKTFQQLEKEQSDYLNWLKERSKERHRPHPLVLSATV